MRKELPIHPYSRRNGSIQKKRYGKEIEIEFICKNCRRFVSTHDMQSGVRNRNHCPYCLHSRHVDLTDAGDRLSACKSVMEPVGLTCKRVMNKYGSEYGELMLIHLCKECGKVSINRIARDDDAELIFEYYRHSLGMPVEDIRKIESHGIYVLGLLDQEFVSKKLFGVSMILEETSI